METRQEQVVDGIEDEDDVRSIILQLKNSEINHPWRFEEIDLGHIGNQELIVRLVISLVRKATALRFYNCTLPTLFYRSLADCLRRGNKDSLRELGFLCFHDDITMVMEAIKMNRQLTTVELNEIACINDSNVVFEIIESNPALQVLDLSFNVLGDDFVNGVAAALDRARGKTRLRRISLHDCEFGDEGLTALSNVIGADPLVRDDNGTKVYGLRLQELMVDHNSFTDDGMMALQAALRTVKRNNANVLRMFPPNYLPRYCDDERIEQRILSCLHRNRTLEGLDRLKQEREPSAAWCYAISRPRPRHADLVFWLLKQTAHLLETGGSATPDLPPPFEHLQDEDGMVTTVRQPDR